MRNFKKQCICCGKEKLKSLFGKTPRAKDGRSPYCKLCIVEKTKWNIRDRQTFPKFVTEVNNWPIEKIASEMKWLDKKLKVLRTVAKIKQQQELKSFSA